jgi:hypothetical protein
MTESQQPPQQGPPFERELAENCVEYFLFLLDDEVEARNQLAKLETIRKAALQLCQSVAKDYIWQRDEFTLELKTDQSKQKVILFLQAMTNCYEV